MNKHPEKGDILRVKVVEELSEAGFDTYIIRVESTVDIIAVSHYGGGIALTVLDITAGYGVYSRAFRNICELRRIVKHDDRYYYFPLLTPGEVWVRKDQLEEVLKKINKHFFECTY